PSNVIQEKHATKNIDSALACKEHDEFIEVLENEGVEVILEDTHERFPYAVNTRDLGVTTPKGIVFGRFTSPYRWGEHRLVETPFEKIKYIHLNYIPVADLRVEILCISMKLPLQLASAPALI